jgi:hypothetical protein
VYTLPALRTGRASSNISNIDIYQLHVTQPCYHRPMDIFSLIVSSALGLFLIYFIVRLSYVIMVNLINGRKFHQSLEHEFDKLRLSRMLGALGINKTAYIYQTNVNDIRQQMESCASCKNTDVCDEKLSGEELSTDDIAFCNNEKDLKEMQLKEK